MIEDLFCFKCWKYVIRDVDMYINADCYYWNINDCLFEIIIRPVSEK